MYLPAFQKYGEGIFWLTVLLGSIFYKFEMKIVYTFYPQFGYIIQKLPLLENYFVDVIVLYTK